MPEASTELIREFENQLIQRGVRFAALEDGRYELTTDAGQMVVALDNLSRQFTRDEDFGRVSRFIESVLVSCASLPNWQDAKDEIFPMIDSAAVEIGHDTITMPLSDDSILIAVYFDKNAHTIRFLSTDDAEDWGIAVDEIWRAAEATLDGIMQSATVSFLDAGELRLGVIEVHEPHKASLIRAPSLKQKVEPELGWPIYAVAPSRVFVFLISESDADQIGRLGTSVLEEFKTAEYPISAEVWQVGNAGIKAIGTFSTG